ncbi:MAG: tetratricopeptide repeat protein [Bacteroidota bacterium]
MTGAKSTKLFLIAVLLVMISCNKEKKHLPARFYHNTTSYFNGYYNANELLNITTAKLEDQYAFPYEGFIEVINYGSEQEISTYKGDFDEIIKKNDIVIFKHPNGNYIDDGRLLNGIAWFYKQNYSLAMQNFDEVLEKFPESDRVPETYLWIAKTFYQMENKTMSVDILEDNFEFGNRVISDKALLADLAIFRSRLALEQEEYTEATRLLVEEVENISIRRRRARAHYLLGQLYEHMEDYPKSLEHYQKVLKNTDAYDFRFRAQMKIARLYVRFQGGKDDDDLVQKYLTKLVNDEKNEDNLDQIYYEFALLEQKKDSLHSSLSFLRQSLQASKGDPIQKTLSYYKSGEIYFYNFQQYPEAQAYYDSAAQAVTPEMSEHDEIKRLAKTLGEYITYKETITYQDSMLMLAELPKETLDSIVEIVIAEEKRKEEERKAKEIESQLSNSNLDDLYALNNPNSKGSKNQGGEWYFDNPATISSGRIEFQQIWGTRRNEDNWRRKNKALSSSVFAANQETETVAEEVDSTLLKSVGDKYNYYKDIPKNEEEKAVANAKVEEALYMLGQIYFQKLEEPDSAIATLEYLLDRFEDSEYTLRARYALYQLYAEKESPIAEAQRNFIINQFPNSVYAYLIEGKNPDELKEDEQDYAQAYEGLYNAYQGRQYRTSLDFSEFILQKYADKEGIVAPEVYFIRGMSYGYLGKNDSMKVILTELVNAFPEADVTPQAKETLRILSQGFSEANPQEVAAAEESANPEDADPNNPRYKGFSKDVKGSDRIFVLMYVSSELPKSELQSKISDFNKAEFKDQKLRVFTFAYTKTQKLLPYISRFSKVEDAEKYIKTFKDSEVGKEILTTEEDKIFFITHTNFKTAYGKKRMEDYISFYQNIMKK